MGRSLANYIRSFRRKSWLSQDEVAFLLGQHAGTSVLRHECGQRVPTLGAALRYAAIFRTDPRELFAGRYEAAERLVHKRAQALLERIEWEPDTDVKEKKRAYLVVLAGEPDLHVVPCEDFAGPCEEC